MRPSQRAKLWRGFTVLVSLAIGVVVWQVATQGLPASVAAPPLATWQGLLEMIGSGALQTALASSMTLFLVGLVVAVVTAVPIGLLLARSDWARLAFGDWILLLYAMPTVALIPFILSLFGIGFGAKLLVVVLFAFFPILYNTQEGARAIHGQLFEVARSFRSSERALWMDVLLPGALPFVMTGLRQAIGRALVGMIAAEIFLTASGLGELMMIASRDFDTPALFASILVVTVLGAGLAGLGSLVEARFTVWKGPRG
jgi:ABC-type nitrate/sulfonate/bicarbonate transport system permease component